MSQQLKMRWITFYRHFWNKKKISAFLHNISDKCEDILVHFGLTPHPYHAAFHMHAYVCIFTWCTTKKLWKRWWIQSAGIQHQCFLTGWETILTLRPQRPKSNAATPIHFLLFFKENNYLIFTSLMPPHLEQSSGGKKKSLKGWKQRNLITGSTEGKTPAIYLVQQGITCHSHW